MMTHKYYPAEDLSRKGIIMIDWLGLGILGIGILFFIAGISLIFEVPQIMSILEQFVGVILVLIGGGVGYFGYKLVKIADE